MFPALNAAMVAQWGLFLDSSPCCPENDPRPCHVQAVVSFIKQWETMVASLRGLLAARKALGSCQKRSLTVLCRLLALVVGWQAVLSAEKVGELQRLVLKQVLSCLQLDVACTGQMLGDDACANPDTTLSPMNAIVPLLIPCVLHSPGAKESVLAAMVLQYVGLCATFEAPHDPRPFPIEPETAHMDTSRSRADACRWPTVLRSDEELNAVAQFVWETVTALHSNPPTGTISDPNNESINSTVSGGASRAHSQLHPLYAALLTGDPSALACHVLQRSNETLRTRAQMVLYCSAMNLVDSRCFVQQLQCQSPGSGGATNATAALHHDRDSGCESQPTLQHDTIASPSDPACRAGDDGAATGSTASLSLLFDVLLPRIVGVLASIMSDSCPGFAAGHSPGSTPSHATSPACLQQLLSAAYSALAQALKLSATLSARLPPQTASARLPGTLHRALDACWYGLVLADQGLAAEPWGLMDLLQNLVKALATVGHCPVSGTDARTVVGLRPDSRPHPGPSHTHAIPPHISCDAGRDPTASLNDPSSSTEGTALRRLASMALQLHARSPGPALALLQALLPHVGAQYIVRVCPGVAGKLLAPCVTSAEAATTCDFLAALMTEGGGRGPTDRVPDLSQLLQQIAHYMYWNAIEGLPETDEQQPAVPGPNPACPSPAGAFWRRASVLGKHLLRPLLRHDPMILEVLWIALVEMHASAVARFDVEATSVTTPSPDSPDTLPPPAAPSPTSASAHIAALDFSVLTSVTVLLHAATGVSGAAAFDHSLGGIAVPRGADSCASPAALDPVPRSVSTARQAVLHAATHHHWRLRLLAVDTLLQFVSPPTSKAVRKSRKAAKPPTTDAPAGGPPATDPRQVLVFACELMESAVPLMVDMDVNALPHRAQVLSALTKWLERLVVWRTCSGGAQTAVAGPQSSSDVCVPGAQGIRVTVCAHLHALSRVLQSAVVQAEHDRVCSLATQGLTKLWRLHGAYLRERAPGALPEWQWPSGGGLPEVEDPQCPQPLVSVLLQDLLLGIDNYATHTYALLTCLVPSPPGGCQTEPPGPAPDPMPGSRHAFEGPGGCSAERVRRTCAQALELLCSRRPETYVCGHMLLKLITEHMPYAVVLAFGGGDEGAVRSRAARSGSAPDAGESKGPRLGPAVSLDPPLNTETHGDRDPDSEELRVRLVLQPSHTERVLGLLDLGMDLIRAQLARHQRPSSREGPASEVGELDPRDRRGIIGGLSLLRSALDELVAAVGAPPGPGLATGLQRRLAERVRRLMALLGRLLAGEGCAVRVAGWGGTQGTAGAQAAQDLAAGVVVDWRALKEIAMLLRALVCGGATGLADALATESAAAPAPAPACQSPDSPAADPSQCPAPHSPTAACATEADLPCRGCPDGPAPGRHVYTAAAGLWCMRLLLSTAHSATVNQASQEVAHIAQALLAHPCPRVAALPEQWMHGLLGACGIRPPIPGPVALGHADPATAHDPQSDPQRGHSAGAPTVRDAGHGHAPFRLNSFPDSGSNPRSEPDPNPRPAGGPGLDAPRRTLPTLAFPDHSTVRRSSGLPFAFVALLGAEKRAARSAMLQLCLPRLMRAATDTGDACSTPGSSPARGDLPASPSAPGPASKAVHPDTVVHTLNILHFLVSDPVGWEVLRPSGDLLLQAGVRGFTAASYPLRNAATMLLCAVLSRTLSVDVKAGSGGEGDDVAKVEAGPDAGALLALHPALLEFLVETFCRQPTQTPSPTGASAAAPENSPSAPGPDPLCAPAPSQPSTRAPIPGPREPTASDAADSHFSALVLLCRLSSPLPPVRFSPGAAPGPTEPRGGRVARALEAIFGALNRDFAQRTWFERKVMATVRAVLHTIEPPDPTPRATPPEPAQARPGAPPVPQSRYIARLAHTLTAQLQSRNNNAIHGVLLQLLVLLQSLAHPLAGTSAPFGPDAEPVVALPPLLPTTTAEQVVEAVLHLCHWVRALSEVQMADARLWQPPGVSPVCVAAWLQLIGQLVGLFVRVLSVHRALSTGSRDDASCSAADALHAATALGFSLASPLLQPDPEQPHLLVGPDALYQHGTALYLVCCRARAWLSTAGAAPPPGHSPTAPPAHTRAAPDPPEAGGPTSAAPASAPSAAAPPCHGPVRSAEQAWTAALQREAAALAGHGRRAVASTAVKALVREPGPYEPAAHQPLLAQTARLLRAPGSGWHHRQALGACLAAVAAVARAADGAGAPGPSPEGAPGRRAPQPCPSPARPPPLVRCVRDLARALRCGAAPQPRPSADAVQTPAALGPGAPEDWLGLADRLQWHMGKGTSNHRLVCAALQLLATGVRAALRAPGPAALCAGDAPERRLCDALLSQLRALSRTGAWEDPAVRMEAVQALVASDLLLALDHCAASGQGSGPVPCATDPPLWALEASVQGWCGLAELVGDEDAGVRFAVMAFMAPRLGKACHPLLTLQNLYAYVGDRVLGYCEALRTPAPATAGTAEPRPMSTAARVAGMPDLPAVVAFVGHLQSVSADGLLEPQAVQRVRTAALSSFVEGLGGGEHGL